MDDFFESFSSKREKTEILDKVSAIPSNYVGSKRRLLVHIWDMLEKHDVKFDSAFDAFSGSAMVSLLFKFMGKKVYSNDLLTSSAITAVCLLESKDIPLSNEDLKFLCTNVPKDHGTFVLDNYKNKFFTEKECLFLDRFKKNVETLSGNKFYCGLDLLNKATLMSVPNSNFTVYGKDLKQIRSTHTVGESYWTEKWRDTTRKRRDANNEIKFQESIKEMSDKYKSAFSLFAVENHVNQHCFLGGRYYNGQTVAKMEHRINHEKNSGKQIDEIPLSLSDFKPIMKQGENFVFNSDIIDLLESKLIIADLIYVDPP
jgi:adenine-specific DNA methylase